MISWTLDENQYPWILKTLAQTRAGLFIAAGNASSSCLLLVTLDTQMMQALLQELLMALRANDADGYKDWPVNPWKWS